MPYFANLPPWPEPIHTDLQRRIYDGQTAVLTWLRSRGHQVEFARDYSQPPAPSLMIASPKMLKNALGKPCPYCGKPMMRGTRNGHEPTRDHVVPRSAGGQLGNGNCLIVCRHCNSDKDDMTLAEWHTVLLKGGDRRAAIVAALMQTRLGLDPQSVDQPG